MLSAPGILFPYLQLWSKAGKELSIENYFGAPSCWLLPGEGCEASMSSIAEQLRDLDYDPEFLAIHALLREKDRDKLKLFRAQNCKLIEGHSLEAVSDALDLSVSSRPWTALVLDRLGRVVEQQTEPDIDFLFQATHALASQQAEVKQVSQKHAPVTVLRSCVPVGEGSILSEFDISSEQCVRDLDYCLLTSAVTVIHRSFNFRVTRRSQIEVSNDVCLINDSVNRVRRFSRFTCLIVGSSGFYKLSFPEFSQNYYSFTEGDLIVFPSNLLCEVEQEGGHGEMFIIRLFDDASASDDEDALDESYFESAVMGQVYPAYIDGQDVMMPSYTVEPEPLWGTSSQEVQSNV